MKKVYNQLLLLIAIPLFFCTCVEENISTPYHLFDIYQINTEPFATGVTISCAVMTEYSIDDLYILYTPNVEDLPFNDGEQISLQSIQMTPVDEQNHFSVTIDGLQENLSYYFCFKASNAYSSKIHKQHYTFQTVASHSSYVDLGLSVKWATCNLGAENPEEFGEYYSWGEVNPKEYYSWNTYKYCSGSKTTLNKYCYSNAYGNVDNKTKLDATDDAAHVNLGGAYRMPTDSERDELIENCVWKWTTRNGVNGYSVTGPNGKSIFLPAAGVMEGDNSAESGKAGYYWTSSLYVDIADPHPYYGLCVFFEDGEVGKYGVTRHSGISIRPVYDDRPDNLFSISKTKQILFSSGNLQYKASTNTWRFAPNQYDYIGASNANISSSYTGWIDLFGWGTGNNPTNKSTSNSNYSTFVDWGNKKIGNDPAGTWRTLTYDEWYYLRYTRPNAGKLCGIANVNSVNGLIILPDNWVCPSGVTFKSGFHSNENLDNYATYQSFKGNTWERMEQAGAVFLPNAGYRYNTTVDGYQEIGYYWLSTEYEVDGSYYPLIFCIGSTEWKEYYEEERYCGMSVRLVKDL